MDNTFVIFSSELDCDCFNEKLNLLHPALKFTVEKKQNNSLNFLDVLVVEEGSGFLTALLIGLFFPDLLGNNAISVLL